MEKKSVIVTFVVLILLALLGSGAGIYYYVQFKTLERRVNDPRAQAKDVLAKVGKLIDLPTGEEPTIATVQDAEKIKNQPFFAKAQNGYTVILYTNTRMAILFDDKNNKIINVGTINVGTPSASPNPTIAP